MDINIQSITNAMTASYDHKQSSSHGTFCC